MVNKKVDLTLNTAIKTTLNDAPLPSVITYDEKAYCAMIPNPPQTSFVELILKPFDGWTWIILTLTVAVCAIVWRLYRFFYPNTGNSTWYFIYGVFVFFIGQGLSFRGNRKKQVLLLQLCIMMTFILGNSYQSILITFMTEARNGLRLQTYNDLVKSDFNLKVDPLFYDIIKSSKDFPNFEKRVEKLSLGPEFFYFDKWSKNNTAIVLRCDVAETFYYNLNSSEGPVDYYYMLPEKFQKSLTSFELSDDSPYTSILQHYSNLVFESGIKSHWKNFIIKLKDYRADFEQRYYTNEDYYLKISDLKPVFVVWMLCLLASTFVFLLEIFCHDFLQNLNLGIANRAYWNAIVSMGNKKPKPKKEKVRFIQVKPADYQQEIESVV